MNNIIIRKISFFLFFILIHFISFSQTKRQIKTLKKSFNSKSILLLQMRLEREYNKDSANVIAYAKFNNVPLFEKNDNGNYTALQKIDKDGTPIYYTTFNSTINKTTRVSNLHSNGALNLDLSGIGMEIGIWDVGSARITHQEYNERIAQGDASRNINNHTTHVAGILIASGIENSVKGIAHEAKAVSYDWYKDELEASKAAAEGLLVSNHSYGISPKSIPDWYFGSYIYQAHDWDEIMANAPYYLLVVATGNSQSKKYNEQPNFGSINDNYDLLVGFALSKNGITVGATEYTNIDNNGNLIKAKVADFSSFGPADDGRIKPDLVGHGQDIYSSISTGNSAYGYLSGTSSATPGVSGALLLLQQHAKNTLNKYLKAATLKGLALHSADDISTPGPDAKTGWGLMNAKRAAEIITSEGRYSSFQELELLSGERYTYLVKSDGKNPLMASISWTDLAGEIQVNKLNDTSPSLIQDLDLKITRNGTTFLPWKLCLSQINKGAIKGDNTVDPFEKVEVNDAYGEYKITVTHKGNLVSGKQNFSLIITGINTGAPANYLKDTSIPNHQKFKIFPNPSSNAIQVYNYDFKVNSKYKIISNSGSIINTGNVIKNKSIDISKLTTGMYILVIEDNNNNHVSKKFFKE